MLSKRIIPCLDIKEGRTVKGVHFKGLQDAGDPIELAVSYEEQQADELVFLDITASQETRKTLVDLVDKVAAMLSIPFTVGGGISSEKDVEAILKHGADKVSVNSSAVKEPLLIKRLSEAFGSQCIVLAVDAKKVGGQWIVHTHGGMQPTQKELFSWVEEAESLGAGEVLFTSMDHDGTKGGFANDALARMEELLAIPIIASGGAGNKGHFADVFLKGKAAAALAASVFHYGEITIPELKEYLMVKGIPIRD